MATSGHGEEERLTFCRPRDDKWTATLQIPLNFYNNSHDILYYNGLLYAFLGLDFDCRVAFCDLSSSPPTQVTKIMPLSLISKNEDHTYLVYLAEKLLRILRHVKTFSDDDAGASAKSCSFVGGVLFGEVVRFKYEFQVYKLDFQLQRWIEVKTLGDNVLLLSSSVSLSLPAPHCQGDRIYSANDANLFTDDDNGNYITSSGYGVYNLWVSNMVDVALEPCF